MAGKIPQSFIDDLLERTDIVELIDARVKLKKTGRNYSARCPFHEEKTPSFSVNSEKQFYYCFGCGAGGNAISFLMDYDRSTFVESIESLAKNLGIEIPREDNNVIQPQQNQRLLLDLLNQSSEFFQQQLREHPLKNKAIDYLKQRGLTGEITKHFGIGYAPPGWDNLIKALAKTQAAQEQLISTGMVIEKEDHSSCYDRFRDRLMFPIRDNRGRTIAFGGRVLNDEKPKYLNSPETPVFHKQQELYGLYEARQANRHLERLLMVEGYMDVVALAQFGITYAVATLGTSAGTAHMEKVFRHCSEVIFCFDGDEAGRKAAHRALEAVIPLMQTGRQAKFLFLPEGEDPDSLIRKIGTEQFLWQLDQAETLSEHLFHIHQKNLDLTRADDKAKFISNIMPHLQMMPGGALQELLLRSLSEKTGLPIDDIKKLEWIQENTNETAEDFQKSTHRHQPTVKKRDKLRQHDGRTIKRSPAATALALLVLWPEFANDQDRNMISSLDLDNKDIRILYETMTFILETADMNTAKIIGYWQSHNKTALQHLLALELSDETQEQQYLEYKDAICHLQKHHERKNQAYIIENMKTNPNIRFENMSDDERSAYLSIFNKKS